MKELMTRAQTGNPGPSRNAMMPNVARCVAPFSLGVLILVGCAAKSKSPYASQAADQMERSTQLAERLTQQAVEIAPRDSARAEELLKQALVHDLYHGPAHNNLGVLYLARGRLYEAASEFEWAKKLLPGHPDPRMNLAMTLESAGRTDEALDAYRTALEVHPDHLPTLQAMTSLQLRTGRNDESTRANLQTIALRGDASWQSWAKQHLSRR